MKGLRLRSASEQTKLDEMQRALDQQESEIRRLREMLQPHPEPPRMSSLHSAVR